MSDTVMTPIFRADFVKLFDSQLTKRDVHPKKKNSDGSPVRKYGLVMIFEPDADISELKAILTQAKEEKFGAKSQGIFVKSPFRRGVQISDENPMGYDLNKYPQYAGKIVAPASSYGLQPGVVAAGKDPATGRPRVITDAAELYSGCYCRARVNAYGYKGESNGLTFGLVGVQKVRDGEPLGFARGPVEEMFEVFEEATGEGFHADLLEV